MCNKLHFQVIRQPKGRIETGLTGKSWTSLDMENDLFCGNGAQTSALILSARQSGSIVGTILAGCLPNKYGRMRPVQAFITLHSVVYVVLVFANDLVGYS